MKKFIVGILALNSLSVFASGIKAENLGRVSFPENLSNEAWFSTGDLTSTNISAQLSCSGYYEGTLYITNIEKIQIIHLY